MALSIHRVSFSWILEGQGEVIQAAFTMEIALYKCLLTQHSDGTRDAFILPLVHVIIIYKNVCGSVTVAKSIEAVQ